MSELDLYMVKLAFTDYRNRGSFEMPELISPKQKGLFKEIVEIIPPPLFRDFSVQLITLISQEAELASPYDSSLKKAKNGIQRGLIKQLKKELVKTKQVKLDDAERVILAAQRLATSALGGKKK